jgi:hypothetical protein
MGFKMAARGARQGATPGKRYKKKIPSPQMGSMCLAPIRNGSAPPRASAWSACDLSPLSRCIARRVFLPKQAFTRQPKAVVKPPHSKRFAVANARAVATTLNRYSGEKEARRAG